MAIDESKYEDSMRWTCPRCGERWVASGPHNELTGEGCPRCYPAVGLRDRTPSATEVLQRMHQTGEDQDTAIRALGGTP
jgi:hypothetical protein